MVCVLPDRIIGSAGHSLVASDMVDNVEWDHYFEVLGHCESGIVENPGSPYATLRSPILIPDQRRLLSKEILYQSLSADFFSSAKRSLFK